MAVAVGSVGDAIRTGTSRALFDTAATQFDVSSDGQRFLLAEPVDAQTDPPITVVVNWPKLLQKEPST